MKQKDRSEGLVNEKTDLEFGDIMSHSRTTRKRQNKGRAIEKAKNGGKGKPSSKTLCRNCRKRTETTKAGKCDGCGHLKQ